MPRYPIAVMLKYGSLSILDTKARDSAVAYWQRPSDSPLRPPIRRLRALWSSMPSMIELRPSTAGGASSIRRTTRCAYTAG